VSSQLHRKPDSLARRAQAAAAHEKAEKAIRDMVRAREAITFAAVAARAGVSREYLYRAPDLAAKIRAARQQPHLAPVDNPAGQPDPVLAALREHIRRLEHRHADELRTLRTENDQLRRELEATLGRLLADSNRTGLHSDPKSP